MSLEKHLEKLGNLEDVSIESNVKINGEDAQQLFCKNWDAAKKALESAQGMVKNPIVKMIIGIIINVGDGLKAKCPA